MRFAGDDWVSRVYRAFYSVALRVVGSVRRRPLRYMVLWVLATWLPAGMADVVQLFGLLFVASAFLAAGGRAHRSRVEAVCGYWSRVNGKEYKRGWFGLGGARSLVGAESSRGGL